MNEARGRIPAHPFLIALVPVWSLWASNADQVSAVVPLLASLASLVLAALLFGLASALCRSREDAGLAASLALAIFFSHGALADALGAWLAFAIGSAVIALATVALRRADFDRSLGVRIATAGSLALLLYAGAQIGLAGLRGAEQRSAAESALAGPGVAVDPPGSRVAPADAPDVYFIVVDGYARADVLRDVFGFDNEPFLAALRSRGFRVVERATANYAMTHLSLGSVLSATYLDALVREVGQESVSFDAPYALLSRPWVARYLQGRGYRFVQLFTNWGGSERSDVADEGIEYVPYWLRSEYTGVLLRATALRELAPSVAGFHRHALAALGRVPSGDAPTFVFAHLLLPHAPYVFDGRGNVRADIPLHLRADPVEKDKSAAGRADQAYADQVAYLNTELLRTIDAILASGGRDKLLIVQGDHGWASASAEPGTPAFVRARFPILSALRVPDSMAARMRPEMSSVNTFRLVLSELFDADLPLLPDRNFYSWYDAPYRLRDVTDWLREPAL